MEGLVNKEKLSRMQKCNQQYHTAPYKYSSLSRARSERTLEEMHLQKINPRLQQ